MPFCAVKWCGKCSKTSSLAKDGITFHKFPKCLKIKEQWINATRREDWVPGKNHYICSRHFTEDCFRALEGNRRFLFETAVPTQMLPCLVSENLDEASSLRRASPETVKDETRLTRTSHPISSIVTESSPLTENVQNTNSMPSACAKSESVSQDVLTSGWMQNTSVNLLSKPSTYSTLGKRQLYRTVMDLSEKLKQKNHAIKRLRDSNRLLKRKLHFMKQVLEEFKKKQPSTQEVSLPSETHQLDPLLGL